MGGVNGEKSEGVVAGVVHLLEKLGDLIDTGSEFSELRSKTGEGETKIVYGYSFRFGIGGERVDAEHFGSVGPDEESGRPVVKEVREPRVEVYDLGGSLRVVAEIPGLPAADLSVELIDDVLRIRAKNERRRFFKELILPCVCDPSIRCISNENGIVEILLERA